MPDTDKYVSDIVGQKVDSSFDSYGVFIVGRAGGKVYGTARLGLANSIFTYESKGYYDEDESSFGTAYGVGVGLNAGLLQRELNYLKLPEVDDPIFVSESYDTSMITLSLNYYY